MIVIDAIEPLQHHRRVVMRRLEAQRLPTLST
jgi:hypothetical protein